MKRKLQLALLGAATLFAGAASAQTDVTSTYLTNAGFDDNTSFITANLATGNGGNNSAVASWTGVKSSSGQYACTGATQYGSSYTVNSVAPPATDPDGNKSSGTTYYGCLGVSAAWGGSAYVTQATSTALAAGKYTISFVVYNGNTATGQTTATNRFGFIESGGTTHYCTETAFTASAWKTISTSFSLSEDTKGTVSVGFISGGGGSASAPKLFVDKVVLTYLGVDHTDLTTEITTATTLLKTLTNTTSDDYTRLNSTITVAQGVDDNASATMAEVTNAISKLKIAEKLVGVSDLLTNKMSSDAITSINNVTASTYFVPSTAYTASELTTIMTGITTAISTANTSIAHYSNFKYAIDNASSLTAACPSFTDLSTLISTDQTAYENETVADADMKSTIKALQSQAATSIATLQDISSYGSNLSFEDASTKVTGSTITGSGGSANVPTNWTMTATLSGWLDASVQTPSDNFVSTLDGKKYYNFWCGTITSADVNQTISGLPNGKYVITAGMMVSADAVNGNSRLGSQRIYANSTESKYLPEDEYFTLEDGAATLDYNKFITLNALTDVTDGTLKFGLRTGKESNTVGGAGWFKADNVKIYSVSPLVSYTESADNTITDATSANVILTRTLTKKRWNTICLPFALTAEQIAAQFGSDTKVAQFDSQDNSTLNFTTVTAMKANTPYLIYPDPAGPSYTITGVTVVSATPQTATFGNVSFIGTYTTKTLDAGNYFISDNKFYEVGTGSTVTVKPFRAYFTFTEGGSAKQMDISIDGETTSINSINMDDAAPASIFNLNGQKVRSNTTSTNGLQKGIYIINGKQAVVK